METDPRAVCDNLSHVATTDAYQRMSREALAGRDCSNWRVWIRPAHIIGNEAIPYAPYIGREPLNSEWRSLKGVRIGGHLSGNQMHNVCRFALREAPLWATKFGPEHDRYFDPETIPA